MFSIYFTSGHVPNVKLHLMLLERRIKIVSHALEEENQNGKFCKKFDDNIAISEKVNHLIVLSYLVTHIKT